MSTLFVFLLGFAAKFLLVPAARLDVRPDIFTTRSSEFHQPSLTDGCVAFSACSNSFEFKAGNAVAGNAPWSKQQGIACGSFSPGSSHASNFGQLHIATHDAWPDSLQMQAAGYLEGYLTAQQIFDHWYNWKWWLAQQTNDTFAIMDWLEQHLLWVRSQLASPPDQRQAASTASRQHIIFKGRQASSQVDEAQLWQAVGLVVDHFDGLVAGYNARVSDLGPSASIDFIPPRELLALNSIGDILDLLHVLFPDDKALNPDLSQLSPAQLRVHLGQRGHCSALIKVTPDLSDLLMGHVSWFTYSSMTRIYKHYSFGLAGQGLVGKKLSFSSYPGLLSSLDDFYLLGQGLVMLQTSLATLNASVYSSVVPQALLAWERVRAANLLASSGEEWAQVVGLHSSGTYNNQYMVVDLGRFSPGQALLPGLLTVVEQVPGLVVAEDATQVLQYGHWPSYNVPYFQQTYQQAGYQQAAQQLAQLGPGHAAAALGLSYQMAPRAQLFRRDAGGVRDLAGLKALLRSNGYRSDALSQGSPWAAICARGDLDPEHPSPGGCYDGKVTSYQLARALAAEAINGPPGSEDQLPAFSWEGVFESAAHRGMPDRFDFAWEQQVPRW